MCKFSHPACQGGHLFIDVNGHLWNMQAWDTNRIKTHPCMEQTCPKVNSQTDEPPRNNVFTIYLKRKTTISMSIPYQAKC